MHDPYSQITRFGPFTLWHKDPEKHGDDDSCGWFLRHYHLDQELAKIIRQEFEFNFKHNYWFTEDGMPIFSTQGIVLNMYGAAAWKIFYPNRRKYDRFFRTHLYSILKFAENPTDSLHRAITNEYRYRMIEHDRSQVESREERIARFSSVVYSDIMRKLRPWYKHPRWHIHHWRVSFNIYSTPYLGPWLWRLKPKPTNVAPVDQNLRDTV
jgi:hypothetical protein